MDFRGVPIRYEACWMDTFKANHGVEAAVAKCQQYIAEFTQREGHGLYLTGPVGVGKSHLAVAVVNQILKQYPKYLGLARFAGVPELQMLTRKNRATNGDLFVYECIEAPLLLLDDLGSERPGEDSRAMVYTIIAGRYDNCAPTIITSRLDECELEERYGAGFLSRLYAMCSPVELDGPDHRQYITGHEWPSYGA